MSIDGSIITIDAMGCQEKIARDIVSNGADYVLALKANNKLFMNDIEMSFRLNKSVSKTKIESDHGRIEERTISVSNDFSLMENTDKWTGLKSIVRVHSTRSNKTTGETTESTRYFISSLDPDIDKLSHAIRSHWSIENNLHWSLDVSFNEDSGKKRNENAIINFSLLNKIALTAIKSDKENKSGAKSKRLMAAWNDIYLEKLIFNSIK